MQLRRVLLSAVLALSSVAAVSAPPAQAATPKPMATRVFHGAGDSVVHMAIGHHSVLVVLTSASPAGVLLRPLSKGDVEGVYQVWESDAYSGTTALLNRPYLPGVTGFSIRTAGAWTLKVKPITAAPLWRKGVVKGHRDMVFRVYPTTTRLTVANLSFSGYGNFIVSPLVRGSNQGGLVNFMGAATHKRVLLPVGTSYVTISADGSWRLSR